MNYKEMLDKTCCKVAGICKGVNCYTSDAKKDYWSVDLEIQGTKMPVNIRLPEGFPREKLIDYELALLTVCIKPSFDKKGIILEAIS